MLTEMINEGSQRVQALQSEIEDLGERIGEAQSEIEAIHQTHQEGTSVLAKARDQVASLESAYNQAASYAKLKHQRPGARQALKDASDAKKTLDAAKSELERLLSVQAEASQADKQREQELTGQIERFQAEKATCSAEIEATLPGIAQARGELGKERHSEFLKAYQEKQGHVDTLLSELIAAKVELLSLHESGLKDLEAWPELQKDASRLQPASDANLNVLEATLHYVETFLREAKAISELPKDFTRRGYVLWDLALVTPGELQSAARYPDYLQKRLERLQAVISEYSAYLADTMV